MSVLVPIVLISILVTAVDTLVAYDAADDLADHRHQWAEILCNLIDSLVEASGSFVSFATVWDTDSRSEPADMSLSDAMTDLTNLAIPVAGCPLRHLVEDPAWCVAYVCYDHLCVLLRSGGIEVSGLPSLKHFEFPTPSLQPTIQPHLLLRLAITTHPSGQGAV